MRTIWWNKKRQIIFSPYVFKSHKWQNVKQLSANRSELTITAQAWNWTILRKTFLKHRGKRRKCWKPTFSPFFTMFSYAFRVNFNQSSHISQCVWKVFFFFCKVQNLPKFNILPSVIQLNNIINKISLSVTVAPLAKINNEKPAPGLVEI